MQLDDNRTKSGLLRISQSKVRQWRDCKRKFWYAHVVKIQRRRLPRPLTYGRLLHQMHERMAVGKDPLGVIKEIPKEDLQMFEEEIEEYGNVVEDLTYIIEAYQRYWNDIKHEPLEYLRRGNKFSEHEFELESSGYTATRHQREVGAGYFDRIAEIVSGGQSSTLALRGSTEEAQFESEAA